MISCLCEGSGGELRKGRDGRVAGKVYDGKAPTTGESWEKRRKPRDGRGGTGRGGTVAARPHSGENSDYRSTGTASVD